MFVALSCLLSILRLACRWRVLIAPFPPFTTCIYSDLHIQCRTIGDYDGVCRPYLSNTTTYYEPSTTSNTLGFIVHAMVTVLSKECTSNLASFLCRSMYRECQEVTHGSSALKRVMLPSLMVRLSEVHFQAQFSRHNSFSFRFSAVQNVRIMFQFGNGASMRRGPTQN